MMNDSDSRMLLSQLSHEAGLRHQEALNRIVNEAEFSLFAQLKPSVFQDGNQWCVLYGQNLQDGIVGFGDTPYRAMLDWNAAWHKPAVEGGKS